MIDEDLQLAVKRGAAYMDSVMPQWAQSIDLDDLQMDHCEYCIIGQAMGGYFSYLEQALGSSDDTISEFAESHGFDLPILDGFTDENGHLDFDKMHAGYAALETLWTEQVKERLG